MNIFEYENSVFGNDLWNKKTIEEVRKSRPKRVVKDFFITDNDYQEEKYREYQEQNFNEYFPGSYKYRLWR